MSETSDAPGHVPEDPFGYTITEEGGGYVWTRLRDGKKSKPLATREKAIQSAEKDAG